MTDEGNTNWGQVLGQAIFCHSQLNFRKSGNENVYHPGLKAILEDEGIAKLFFDCREDCNALKHLYGVNVNGKLMIQYSTV